MELIGNETNGICGPNLFSIITNYLPQKTNVTPSDASHVETGISKGVR